MKYLFRAHIDQIHSLQFFLEQTMSSVQSMALSRININQSQSRTIENQLSSLPSGATKGLTQTGGRSGTVEFKKPETPKPLNGVNFKPGSVEVKVPLNGKPNEGTANVSVSTNSATFGRLDSIGVTVPVGARGTQATVSVSPRNGSIESASVGLNNIPLATGVTGNIEVRSGANDSSVRGGVRAEF